MKPVEEASIDGERQRADDAEAWCARLANDQDAYRAGEEAGAAKVIQALRSQVNDVEWRYLAVRIKEQCGPAELPPHERALVENRRMRAALLKIAVWLEGPVLQLDESRQAARGALEES